MNLKDMEFTLSKLADADILGAQEREALRVARGVVSTMRSAFALPANFNSKDLEGEVWKRHAGDEDVLEHLEMARFHANPDSAPTGRSRAARVDGLFAAMAYFMGREIDAHIEDARNDHEELGGLLSDVRHWCDMNGIDYAKADRAGYQFYREEVARDGVATGLATPAINSTTKQKRKPVASTDLGL